jgi:zinc protease
MGNAYDISAGWGANYDHPGLFQIAGSTKSVSTVETFQAIREEVERIRTSEVSDEELRVAKDTAINGLVFAFDTRSKTILRLLNYEYYGYPRDFIQQYQKALTATCCGSRNHASTRRRSRTLRRGTRKSSGFRSLSWGFR